MSKITENTSEFLKQPLVSTLATLDTSGAPRTRAIWHDWSEHGLLLFTSTQSLKWKNIEKDDRVSLCIDDPKPPYRSVIIDGHAVRKSNQTELMYPIILRMAQKYYGEIEGKEFANGYKDMTADEVVLFEIVIERVIVRDV
jgi:PPOX class probable F420-dependent enzyme